MQTVATKTKGAPPHLTTEVTIRHDGKTHQITNPGDSRGAAVHKALRKFPGGEIRAVRVRVAGPLGTNPTAYTQGVEVDNH